MSNRGGAVGLGLGSTAYCQPNGYDAYLEGPKYPCFGRVIPFNMLSRFLDPILPSAQRAPTKNNTLFWTEYQAAKVSGRGRRVQRKRVRAWVQWRGGQAGLRGAPHRAIAHTEQRSRCFAKQKPLLLPLLLLRRRYPCRRLPPCSPGTQWKSSSSPRQQSS